MKGKYKKYKGGGKPKKKGLRFSRFIGGPVRYKDGYLDQFEDLMEEQMDKLADRYGWAPDYRDAELPPEYLEDKLLKDKFPSFYDFVTRAKAEEMYDRSVPLDEYTTTYNLGPISLQRWKNAKQSPDGINYRTPYWAADKFVQTGSSKKLGEARASVGVNLGDEQNDILERVPFSSFKLGHQKEKLDNTLLDKVRQTPGTLIPAFNLLFAGGASSGGTAIDEAALLALAAKELGEAHRAGVKEASLAQDVQAARARNASDAEIQQLQSLVRDQQDVLMKEAYGANFIGAPSLVLGLHGNTRSDGLVIPTAGFMRNPFQKTLREEKKKFKEVLKDADERYNQDREEYLMKKSERELNEMLDAYEKEYGVRPVFKNDPITKTPRRKYVIPSNPNRGEYRNPIFLKDGGKVKIKKKK